MNHRPDAIKTKIHTLILQHPQEPDKELGTAGLTHSLLKNSTLRVGLSWPNLKKARYGKEENFSILSPARWAVLYLGTGLSRAKEVSQSRPDTAENSSRLTLVDRKGFPLPNAAEHLSALDGLVVLDGTWSQAKALWWRNPWLLKLRRAVLTPSQPSLYGKLRKEPRRECVSTIESVGIALAELEQNRAIETKLLDEFKSFIQEVQKSYTPEELKQRIGKKAR